MPPPRSRLRLRTGFAIYLVGVAAVWADRFLHEGAITIPPNHLRLVQVFIGFPIVLGALIGIAIYVIRRRGWGHCIARGQTWSFATLGMLFLVITIIFISERFLAFYK